MTVVAHTKNTVVGIRIVEISVIKQEFVPLVKSEEY
jgi:hypothetical protein